ncbi:MAG: hypothetical protein M1833_007211 [Piccolia ochrophora]|nr:MAG: hypothetical protein M1833_007211 [Piccolia ochrophora]
MSHPASSGNSNPLAALFSTPGTRNIEKAYERGGAHATHTPGYGGKRGPDATSKGQGAGENRGVGGTEWNEGIADQRVGPDKGVLGTVIGGMLGSGGGLDGEDGKRGVRGAFNEVMQGGEKGQ